MFPTIPLEVEAEFLTALRDTVLFMFDLKLEDLDQAQNSPVAFARLFESAVLWSANLNAALKFQSANVNAALHKS